MTDAVRNSAPAPATEIGAVCLDDASLERLAGRVAELLAPLLAPRATPGRLVSAAEVAERFGVARAWIYAHATELGAIRLGTGRKPRLRFDPDDVARHLDALTPRAPRTQPSSGRRARSAAIGGDPVELLPIHRQPELSSSEQPTDRPGGAPTPPATAPKRCPPAR